jgi:hypothetical protein
MNRLSSHFFRTFVAFFSLGLCALAAGHSQSSDAPRFSDDTPVVYRTC